jgi:outer membrane lipopolysaccharide assembly protein LptE/RlpB
MNRSAIFTVLAMAAVLAGCGYHVGGQATLMPRNVKTIAIPAFSNGTTRYKLARILPRDITREFLTRTRYRVVTDPNEAEAVLTGSLANFAAYPTLSDPDTGRAASVQVIVVVDLTLTDRQTGKVIWSRKGAEFRDRYQIASNPADYFDESGTAIERVSATVARAVVSAILEAF